MPPDRVCTVSRFAAFSCSRVFSSARLSDATVLRSSSFSFAVAVYANALSAAMREDLPLTSSPGCGKLALEVSVGKGVPPSSDVESP